MSIERTQIAQAVFKVIHEQIEWNFDQVETLIERPRDRSMGDWAFPCFQLAKAFRKSPVDIARGLAEQIKELCDQESENFSLVGSVQATGPYLNFKIDSQAMAKWVVPHILDGSLLSERPDTGQHIMIEYSQPNTHKAFHVGHMRNVALGDALVRITRWSGSPVVAANYIGDVGAHIAKCLWYLNTYFQGEIPDEKRGEFLGEMYRLAVESLDFGSMTRCPVPGVVSAQVLEKSPLKSDGKSNDNLHRVDISVGKNQTHSVVCGGTEYEIGDVVGYAAPGTRVLGRQVQSKAVHGFESEGMICSEKELGLSDDKDRIFVFDTPVELGQELAELMRIEGKSDPSRPVLDIMSERNEGVSKILRDLEAGEEKITQLWKETRQWSMDAFYEIYDWLGAEFNHYFFESDVGDEGKKLVKQFYESGLFIDSEGTIGMDLSSRNLPFFMLLKSDGTGLYSTKDLALAKRKFEDFGIDHSVYVVDASQSLHFQQVFATLEEMGFEQAKDCYHLAYGLVVLPEGKMSSRGGKIILFSELRDLLNEKIKNDYLNKYLGQWSNQEIEDASHKISVATIRYGMLNCDQVKNIVFDLTEWTSKSGNTGPYLLYAYARISSLLGKAGSDWQDEKPDWGNACSEEEIALINQLSEFPQTVMKAAEDHRPQLLCIYLFGLAKAFSRMYDRYSVLKAETPGLMAARLQLAQATGVVLNKGLELLGIETLERM